jgi:hypothetical protein
VHVVTSLLAVGAVTGAGAGAFLAEVRTQKNSAARQAIAHDDEQVAHQQDGGAEDLQSQNTHVTYSFDVVSGAHSKETFLAGRHDGDSLQVPTRGY